MKWSWCSGCLCCNGAVNGSNQNSSRIQDASVETKRAKNFWNETGGPNRLWDIPNIQECQYEMTNCAKSFKTPPVLSLSKLAERSGDKNQHLCHVSLKALAPLGCPQALHLGFGPSWSISASWKMEDTSTSLPNTSRGDPGDPGEGFCHLANPKNATIGRVPKPLKVLIHWGTVLITL